MSVPGPAPSDEIIPVPKGGSLLIAYQLKDRPVLLVGGGVVAAGRLYFLLEAGAHVTIVAPSPLDPNIVYRLRTNPDDITWHDREHHGDSTDPIQPSDYAMVLTAIDDAEASAAICSASRAVHVPVNVADVPPSCDFYFGAQFRRGPLQVMLSTQGQGPKIGAMVRDVLEKALPDDVEDAIAGVGQLRKDLRVRAPGVGGKLGQERMKWMIGMCDEWSLNQMGRFKEEELRRLVLEQGWEKGRKVIGPGQVGVGEGLVGVLSGWWVAVREAAVGAGGVGFLLGAVGGGAGVALWMSRR